MIVLGNPRIGNHRGVDMVSLGEPWKPEEAPC